MRTLHLRRKTIGAPIGLRLGAIAWCKGSHYKTLLNQDIGRTFDYAGVRLLSIDMIMVN